MSATLTQAREVIMTLFKTAWDGTSYASNVVYEDISAEPPNTQAPWARPVVRHAAGGQGTLANDTGNVRWEREGTVIVSIFTPIGDGLKEAYSLAQTVLDGFDGKTGTNGVWFRNGRVNEIGPDGDWFQTNVLVDFTYDEVK